MLSLTVVSDQCGITVSVVLACVGHAIEMGATMGDRKV
jgi:hypothetical protein